MWGKLFNNEVSYGKDTYGSDTYEHHRNGMTIIIEIKVLLLETSLSNTLFGKEWVEVT